jgi:hypothetical protein
LTSKIHNNFNLTKEIDQLICSGEILPPYTSQDLTQNLSSDRSWAPLVKHSTRSISHHNSKLLEDSGAGSISLVHVAEAVDWEACGRQARRGHYGFDLVWLNSRWLLEVFCRAVDSKSFEVLIEGDALILVHHRP